MFTIVALNAVHAQQNQIVLEIDSTIEVLTNNLDKLSKIEKYNNDTLGFSYVYFDDKELKAIILRYNDLPTNTKKDVSWYYSEGELIFSEQKWTNISTAEISNHQKLYANKLKLVAWLKGEEFVDENSTEFQETEKKLIKYAQKKLLSLEKQLSIDP